MDMSGNVQDTSIVSSTIAHSDLLTCMRHAVDKLWMVAPGYYISDHRPPDLFVLNLTFRFQPLVEQDSSVAPKSIGHKEAWASSRLSKGDGESAYHLYTQLIDSEPSHPHACLWHVGALESIQQVAPWLDSRVDMTAERLFEYIHKNRHVDLEHCLKQAAPVLARLVTVPYRLGKDTGRYCLFKLALFRGILLEDSLPKLPGIHDLQFIRGDMSLRLGELGHAVSMFRYLSGELLREIEKPSALIISEM